MHPRQEGSDYSLAADAAGEVPIYYLLFGFGITGAILMVPLYFFMAKLFFKLIRLLRLTLIGLFTRPVNYNIFNMGINDYCDQVYYQVL